MGIFTRTRRNDITAALPTLAVSPSPALSPVTIPEVPDLLLAREHVWKVPAIAQGIQVIAGTIATFPLRRLRGGILQVDSGLMEQLDPLESTSATIAKVVEDLILAPAAYLVVLDRYADGYPAHLRYVPFETVTLPEYEGAPYRIGDIYVPARDVVAIPSHWPGLIATGGRTIRTALALENAVYRNSSTDLPAGILYDTGPDLPGDKVTELLTAWESGRRKRTTGYLGSRFRYERQQWNSEELALVPSRDHQVAEIARLLNLPTRYLNAPTNSSLTYATVEGQRRDLYDTSLRPYLVSIEARLSLGDVTSRGQVVRFDVDDYLRSDTSARFDAYSKALAAGWLTIDEVRAAEHLPPLESL